jgi:hypothetical protein
LPFCQVGHCTGRGSLIAVNSRGVTTIESKHRNLQEYQYLLACGAKVLLKVNAQYLEEERYRREASMAVGGVSETCKERHKTYHSYSRGTVAIHKRKLGMNGCTVLSHVQMLLPNVLGNAGMLYRCLDRATKKLDIPKAK